VLVSVLMNNCDETSVHDALPLLFLGGEHVDTFATQQWHCLPGLHRLKPKGGKFPGPIGGSNHLHGMITMNEYRKSLDFSIRSNTTTTYRSGELTAGIQQVRAARTITVRSDTRSQTQKACATHFHLVQSVRPGGLSVMLKH
jgi:hypothetical protein